MNDKKLFNNDIYELACLCFQGKFTGKIRNCQKKKKKKKNNVFTCGLFF